MRINQYLAKYLGTSRRSCDGLIEKGLVEVNGELAVLGAQVSDQDTVKAYVGSKWVEVQNANTNEKTVLFYKPIFSITTKSDPQKRKTIYNFLPKKYSNLKPAGRLDYMSEGLIVMTNDGELINQLTHPKNDCSKEYLVSTKEPLTDKSLDVYAKGMVIEGYKIKPVGVEKLKNPEIFDYLKLNENHNWYIFKLREGRNNQIRKMVQIDGQKVSRLIRIKHGDFKLSKELKESKHIEL